MSIERGNFSQESEAMHELQVGAGDPINVSGIEKISYQQKGVGGTEPVKEEIPFEHLQEAQEALSKLPFRIGEKEHIATYPRTAHEASVTIGPRSLVHDAPESEKNKKALFIRFDKGLEAKLGFENANNLTFEQHDSKMGRINLIHFEIDEAFKVGDDEIGEVRLVVPVEQKQN